MDGRLDARKIFSILKQYAILIFSLGILTAIVAGVITYYFITPMYQSSIQILVSQEIAETQELAERNIRTDLQLVNTYSELIKSPLILDQVSAELAMAGREQELSNQISVNAMDDSQVITINVRDASQRKAVDIANMTASVFQQEVINLMNINNVKILSPAVVNNELVPISPNPMFNTAIGFAVGLMLGLGIVFLLAYLDTSIKDEQDVMEVLGIPVLAVISPVEKPKGERKSAKVALKEKEA